MSKTQLLNHARGSGLDHEHRLLSGVPQVCEVRCVQLRRLVRSPRAGVPWRLKKYSVKLHRESSVKDNIFQFYLLCRLE